VQVHMNTVQAACAHWLRRRMPSDRQVHLG
jgi:hypothetical protein